MELKEQITLSIIVPCYNVAQYLEFSLSSLVEQFSDWTNAEVILINDGSTDNTLDILKKYCTLYPHIFHLIDKENGGVSSARNIGIQNSNGTWVCFFDPDDELVPLGYERILSCIAATKADLISFGCKVIHSNGYCLTEISIEKPQLKNMTIDEFARVHKLGSSVVFFYKKEIIAAHTIKFPEFSALEDAVFNVQYLKQVSQVSRVNEIIYLYHVNENSATTSKDPNHVRKNVIDIWKAIREIKREISTLPENHWGQHIFKINCRFYFFAACARVTNTIMSLSHIREIVSSAKQLGISIPCASNLKERLYTFLFSYPTIWGGYPELNLS